MSYNSYYGELGTPKGRYYMYKDKAKQRAAVKKAVDRHRVLQKGITSQSITPKGITESATYVRPIIRAIADPIKRAKLRQICQSLETHNVLDRVYYGCGDDPVRMDEAASLLLAVK